MKAVMVGLVLVCVWNRFACAKSLAASNPQYLSNHRYQFSSYPQHSHSGFNYISGGQIASYDHVQHQSGGGYWPGGGTGTLKNYHSDPRCESFCSKHSWSCDSKGMCMLISKRVCLLRICPNYIPPRQPKNTEATRPTVHPTRPTVHPTRPTVHPTRPTVNPTGPIRPTVHPTRPTVNPTRPTIHPTRPTVNPTGPSRPTVHPTRPTVHPTRPTVHPTRPTVHPTRPTVHPTRPTVNPTRPTVNPTDSGSGGLFIDTNNEAETHSHHEEEHDHDDNSDNVLEASGDDNDNEGDWEWDW